MDESQIAKHLKSLEELIQSGNKEAVKRKKDVLLAKTSIIKVMKKYDERIEKIKAKQKEDLQELDAMAKERQEKLKHRVDKGYDKLRATTDEVKAIHGRITNVEDRIKTMTSPNVKYDRFIKNFDARLLVLEQQVQQVLKIVESIRKGEKLY